MSKTNDVVVFVNKGIMSPDAFSTFGVNAKPNSDNAIGYFGTGLKYAIAIILREGGNIKIISDGIEYTFYTKKTMFRGIEIEKVRCRVKDKNKKNPSYISLPFTLEVGKNWELWQALRELESNTRDEQGSSYIIEHDNAPSYESIECSGVKESTFIVVDLPEFTEIVENSFNEIFPNFNSMDMVAESINVEVYNTPSKYFYFKGIRAYELDTESKFTYNFNDGVFLTEDRSFSNTFHAMWEIARLVVQSTDSDFIKDVLETSDDYLEYSLEYNNFRGSESKEFITQLSKSSKRMSPLAGSFFAYIKERDAPAGPTTEEMLIKRIQDYKESNEASLDPELLDLFEDILEHLGYEEDEDEILF